MIRDEDQKLLIGLVKRNLITNDQLQNFVQTAENSINLQGIVQTLIRKFNLQEDIIAQVIAEEFNIPFLYATEGQNWVDVPELPEEASSKYRFIPIIVEDLEITVAFIDPPYKRIINLIETTTRREVVPVVITVTAFDNLIAKKSKKFKRDSVSKFNFDKLDVEIRGEKWANSIESATKFPPASVIFTRLLENAEFYKATEMHWETTIAGHLKIKMRIEGILQRVVTLPKRLANSLFVLINPDFETSEQKYVSGTYILKNHNKKIPLPYHSIKTVTGRKLFIQLPKQQFDLFNLDDLGYSETDLNKAKFLASKTPGLVLISGSSYSGKHTTYYALLKYLDANKNSIISLEYEIYSELENITQIQIDPKASSQDIKRLCSTIINLKPDYLFMQKINKADDIDFINTLINNNAKVFAIYPAVDSIKAIFQIKKMLPNFSEFINNLSGVIAQKMIRKICTNCSIKYRPDEEDLEKISLLYLPDDVYLTHGEGCAECDGTGYNKIAPLVEVLIMTDKIKKLFIQNQIYETILFEAQKEGFTNMRFDGIRKVLRGVTTIEEVLRVT